MADEPWEGESVEPLNSTCISTLVNFGDSIFARKPSLLRVSEYKDVYARIWGLCFVESLVLRAQRGQSLFSLSWRSSIFSALRWAPLTLSLSPNIHPRITSAPFFPTISPAFHFHPNCGIFPFLSLRAKVANRVFFQSDVTVALRAASCQRNRYVCSV